MNIIRNELGDIDIDSSLQKFKEDLTLQKELEIPASQIMESVNTVLGTYKKVPKTMLVSYVVNSFQIDLEDYNKVVKKVETVIESMRVKKMLVVAKGTNGGVSKC